VSGAIASRDSEYLITVHPEPFDKLRTGGEERACRRMQAHHTKSVCSNSLPRSPWEYIPNFATRASEEADHPLTLRLLRAQGERGHR